MHLHYNHINKLGGYAFVIRDKCNLNSASHSFTGSKNRTYTYTKNELCGGNDLKSNRYHFKVLEYEVYQLI